MSDATANPKNEWLRWIALPFAAGIGGTVGAIALTLFLWLGMKMQGGFSEDGWYYRYVLPVMSSAAFGAIYSYIAWAMAPRGKQIAGTVMTTLLCMLMLLSIVITWGSDSIPAGRSVQVTIGAVVTCIASVATLVSMWRER